MEKIFLTQGHYDINSESWLNHYISELIKQINSQDEKIKSLEKALITLKNK